MSDIDEPQSTDVERVYQEFWKPIVEIDGKLDVQQVKQELFDFWQVMERVPKVYCHITGDQVSNMLTDVDVVCSLADDYYSRQESCCCGAQDLPTESESE